MSIEQEIKDLAKKYADTLKSQIDNRMEEMKSDDKSHYLVYQVLGVTDEEGHLIDLYQGIGGQYYYGDSAWEYVKERTGIDLKNILEKIANENSGV